MIEEQIDLDEIKKICNLSQKHEILKGIVNEFYLINLPIVEIAEEISAGMSDHEKSLSKAISFGTIYTLDNESVVAPDTKRDKTPFENQGIREKCEVPTVETKKEVADFQMQWNVETIDQWLNTELGIQTNDVEWCDVDLEEDLGKEAAKTIVALNHYLKSKEPNQYNQFQNSDLKELNLFKTFENNSNELVSTQIFSPQVSQQNSVIFNRQKNGTHL